MGTHLAALTASPALEGTLPVLVATLLALPPGVWGEGAAIIVAVVVDGVAATLPPRAVAALVAILPAVVGVCETLPVAASC